MRRVYGNHQVTMTNTFPAVVSVEPATRNRLLAELAPDDFARIASFLEPMAMRTGTTLHEPNARIQHVYFPTSGAVSMIVVTPDGAIEAGSVGNEGFAGIAALLHADIVPTHALVQAAGQAYRMKVTAFRVLMRESLTMQQLFSRYAFAFLNQVAQLVACNRLHSLEARCARWLLMTHDRIDGDQIRLTHESLSFVLGVHRPAVTLALGILQESGVIEYTRGRIHILDRAGLERAACSCYRAIRQELDALVQRSAGLSVARLARPELSWRAVDSAHFSMSHGIRRAPPSADRAP